ncbi:hypothetical protein, conserved [Plasmodium gonderi]|uniref:Uncharacterized protein n=1 Tax=Plasmodium gonderi TaxID=77519 RepID=A0A1Y1JN31_PLAGO|nr:hypothetical protein, conserved [Plasmodium gonderi]GAW81803.1 hypothetical protein, conserved [Plasmodium gonderi]
MKISLFLLLLLFLFFSHATFAFTPTKINSNSLTFGAVNYYNHGQRKKAIRSTIHPKIHAYPNFVSNIIEPLSNKNFKKYFLFRSLSRICVSLSSAFSLNARIYLYRKNNNNVYLTQALIYNEILIKMLKICWLYKLSSFVDRNIKLCRIMSTVFYVIGIYFGIASSTWNFSKNSFFFSYILYTLSSILQSLSIMTYASIRSATNLRLCQILNTPDRTDLEIVNTNSVQSCKDHSSNVNPVNHEPKKYHTDETNFNKIPENYSLTYRDQHVNIDLAQNSNASHVKLSKGITTSLGCSSEIDQARERDNTMEIHSNNKDFSIHQSNCTTESGSSSSSSRSRSSGMDLHDIQIEKMKIYHIGEVSVITDLLASVVDLVTVVILARATKWIKQKLYFYVMLSSLHLFFSYKELQCLLN